MGKVRTCACRRSVWTFPRLSPSLDLGRETKRPAGTESQGVFPGPRSGDQEVIRFAVTKDRHDVEKIMGQAIRSQTWSNLFQRKFAKRFYLFRVDGNRREVRRVVDV